MFVQDDRVADVILQVASNHFGVKVKHLQGPHRCITESRKRMVIMWLMRKLTPLSCKQIGSRLGGRDHSTVIAGVNRIEEEQKSDPELRATLNTLMAIVEERRPLVRQPTFVMLGVGL